MTPDQVATALTRAVGALVERGDVPAAGAVGPVVLERPHARSEADWASPFPLRLAPAVDPGTLAALLDRELAGDGGIASVGVTATGHLVITLVDRTPGRVALDVLAAGPAYGRARVLPAEDCDARDVQYAASRAAAVLRHARAVGVEPDPSRCDPALLAARCERRLLDALAEFPLVTEAAARRDRPETLRRHLEVVADRFLDSQAADPALPRGDQAVTLVHRTRVVLVAATRQVLENGLGLLALPAPERM